MDKVGDWSIKKELLPLDGDGPMCTIMLCIPISGRGVTVLPPPTKCTLSYKDWGGVLLNNWVADRVGGVGCPQVNIWYKNLLMGPMLVCETGMESNELISSPSIFMQKTTCSLSQ